MTLAVAVLGALDTKAEEYGYLIELLRGHGVDVLLLDTGVLGSSRGPRPDIGAGEIAAAAGTTLEQLRERGDRASGLAAMAAGAAVLLRRLHEAGRIRGAMALGGTGGTSVAAEAFRVLPLGVPKIIVSTAASGNTAAYVGETDLVLMPSVTDVAGLNRLLRRVIGNAAAAMAGMLAASPDDRPASERSIGASMFGLTTPCVDEARRSFDAIGWETVVFHMTGSGGRALEQLIRDGWLDGVLDVTTTELADELVGGVFDAGPGRLTGAAAAGLPQVVSVGALDMVNFGARDTVPARFADRRLHVHNASVTLMRTSPEECAELGRRLATRVSATSGPATVFLPLRGISGIATLDEPFWDPEADRALFDAVRAHLDRSRVDLVELDTDINDPDFATAMAERLMTYLGDPR
jgi:uncharacterized protein (UPF0261 family)